MLTHNTVVPFLYNIYYTFIINQDLWDSLTPAHRQAIDEAAYEAEAAAINFAEDSARVDYQALEAGGMKMHLQTPAEREAWKTAYQDHVIEAVVKKSNDPEGTRRLIQWIKNISP